MIQHDEQRRWSSHTINPCTQQMLDTFSVFAHSTEHSDNCIKVQLVRTNDEHTSVADVHHLPFHDGIQSVFRPLSEDD